ncbi:hypothetical protein [Thiobacillus sp.]|uniref:hypothetical protein n=1 Tax=Thiobacillus sp. TaxID=924 RepID=UPI0017BDC2C5|nr:hypothetical protein [Thiobacillus sp.]MBC2730076.1 hypothetical protein [Thiobacillus sp.]MBC2738814.1 hypothetical protein [Thiobacillus sp.]MBC2760895.1 hypothetical protein [Thiobacillus sp.]MBD3813324.1 hypothetical protein [Betaproteobacteria bacterium]
MNKTSSKLAAGMRKVKAQQENPVAKTEPRKAATPAPKPTPSPKHPDRIWPD